MGPEDWDDAHLFEAWQLMRGRGTGRPGELHVLRDAEETTLDEIEAEARKRGILVGEQWSRPER